MKILKKIILAIVCVMIVISAVTIVKADDDSYQYLNSLNFDVQINSDGSMDVVETWDIQIEYTNTLFKTFEIDSSKYSSITDGKVSIVQSDGTEYELENCNQYYWHVPTGEYYFLKRESENTYEVAWGTGLEKSKGTVTYKISYHVNDAIAKYDDVAEMYWQFLGSNYGIAAKKITGTITLPENANSTSLIRVWGHTPDLNGTINVTSTNTVEFEVTNNKTEKMVEVRIAMPTDIITSSGRTYSGTALDDIISEETDWANEANATRIAKILIAAVICLVVFGVLIYYLIKSIKQIKNTVEVKPSVKYDYYRELPRENSTPAEALYILKGNYSGFAQNDLGKIFSATVLSLSLKKSIKVEKAVNEKGKEDSKITLLGLTTENQDEVYVYNFIEGACKDSEDKISVTMTEMKKYIKKHSEKVVSLKNKLDIYMKKHLIENGILDSEGIKRRNANAAGCFIYMIIMAVMVFISEPSLITNFTGSIGIPLTVLIGMIIFMCVDIWLINKASKKVSIHTQAGADEREKWKALKKYMEDFSLLNEKDIPDLALWEIFLVYATAFGISEKVIDQLKIVYPDYENMSFATYPNMYIIMNTDFTHSFNSVSNAMSSSFSSGSGGGGGFSGGGGGRWWPAAGGGGR